MVGLNAVDRPTGEDVSEKATVPEEPPDTAVMVFVSVPGTN